jgi:hypothetical protein
MPIKGAPKQIIVDFTNVSEGSGYSQTHVKAGDYRGKVKSVEYGESKENKTPMLTYALALAHRPSATYRYNCPLTEKSLWKLRKLLVACGVNVPAKKLNVAGVAEKIVGKELGICLDDDEYNGKLRSQVVDVIPAADLPQDVSNDDDDTVSDDDVPADDDAPVDDAPADEGEEDLEELDLDDM